MYVRFVNLHIINVHVAFCSFSQFLGLDKKKNVVGDKPFSIGC